MGEEKKKKKEEKRKKEAGGKISVVHVVLVCKSP